jgi:hypothetical protein
MRKAFGAATGILAALVLLGTSAPVSGLYAYVPNVLVVQSAQDADSVLTALEISMGVQPATNPATADRPDLARLDREARIMEKHWRDLDAACDPNAVFARMYLTTTYGVRYHIQERYFADNDYLSVITVSFAKMYLDAYANWKAGHPEKAPAPWREAFDWARGGKSSLTEDEFLGMNAHINYDLTNAIVGLGTTNAAGESRKPDMDRINHVLADVYDDVQYDIARYYGPTPPTVQPNRGEGHDPSAEAVEAPVFAWREHAWQNAVLLESMQDASSRQAFDGEMQAYSGTIAKGLEAPDPTSTSAARVAYCQTHS